MSAKNLNKILNEICISPELKKAEWIGLREVRERHRSFVGQDGKIRDISSDNTHGIMVEVFFHGQMGYSASPSPHVSAVLESAIRALRQAQAASKWSVAPFDFGASSPRVRPVAKGHYASPKSVSTMSPAAISELVVMMSGRMQKSSKIVQTLAYIDCLDGESRLVSTSGTEIEQELEGIILHFQATAQDGSITQKRSDGENLQGNQQYLTDPSLWLRVDRVAEQSLELLSAPECPNETTSVVLMPSQMTLQIHESIGHPLEIDRILGDERNYAGWSFVRAKDFGNLQYGSKLLNVTFDPTVSGELASYSFDDGGNPAKREHLIRDGLLIRGLGGLESQTRSKIPGVANFRASSWNRPPVDRMANINLEPGSSSFDQIISSIESGILMDTNRSWSIDDYRNKFQFGCEYAKRIQNGKITHTIRNPNYRGITTPFWNGLKMVGEASTLYTHGTPNCGKAEPNQVIRVGHRSPVCLFENVEVFGGAK
ncbi:MAG: TldD/PmbA family protein [Bdellovibrionales bacterium]|nr:TldD/PmbA family protein [Bdellovibrionales bacterium]